MYLATVTCDRDFLQLLLQAESIQKFLKPCKHVIIINQDNPDIDFYYKWLSPYYNNHELVILPKIKYSYSLTELKISQSAVDWRLQQLQKLLLAYEFSEDYVLLDTKNFFVKEANLDFWENPNIYGSGKLDYSSGFYEQSSSLYRKLLNVSNNLTLLPGTPFRIHRNLFVDRCKKEDLGYYLFYPELNLTCASEFKFYSVLINDKLQECKDWPASNYEKGLWQCDVPTYETVLEEVSRPYVYVSGFHRDFLNCLNQNDVDYINNWLNTKLGLKNKIYPLPKDSDISK